MNEMAADFDETPLDPAALRLQAPLRRPILISGMTPGIGVPGRVVGGRPGPWGGPRSAGRARAPGGPVEAPPPLAPARAGATNPPGFGVAATLSYDPPFTFARRMTPLDHLTDGRIGWNIVT